MASLADKKERYAYMPIFRKLARKFESGSRELYGLNMLLSTGFLPARRLENSTYAHKAEGDCFKYAASLVSISSCVVYSSSAIHKLDRSEI